MTDVSNPVLTAFGALSATIIFLWARIEYGMKRMETKLDKCEQDRLDLWKELAKK